MPPKSRNIQLAAARKSKQLEKYRIPKFYQVCLRLMMIYLIILRKMVFDLKEIINLCLILGRAKKNF